MQQFFDVRQWMTTGNEAISKEFLLALPEPLAHFLAQTRITEHGSYEIPWRQFTLRSAFQPIVSFTHNCIVGHEALVRPITNNGIPIPPPELFSLANQFGEQSLLDRACRALHFLNAGNPPGWLFLNFLAADFGREESDAISHQFMQASIEHLHADMSRVVVEVVEDAVDDTARFEAGAQRLRSYGIGLALDDFGAGASNFDRVWKIEPEIVKLDRSFTQQSTHDGRMRRMLPRIVELLHEAGAQVVLEGIETEEQALIALDANVDYGQGWFLGHPQPRPHTNPLALEPLIESLWTENKRRSHNLEEKRASIIDPILEVMQQAAGHFRQWDDFAESSRRFLEIHPARRIYVVGPDGRLCRGPLVSGCRGRMGRTCIHCSHNCPDQEKPRYNPIPEPQSCLNRARLTRQPFFRRALSYPHSVQITRPYISFCDGKMTTTVSKCISIDGEFCVLCGDLDWNELNHGLHHEADWLNHINIPTT